MSQDDDHLGQEDEDPSRTLDAGKCLYELGSHIGSYKLLRILGEGGFGIVYLAEQQRPMKRQVALKIVKPGMDSAQVIRRFEAERQALALLDHPNVAHVYDAGTTEAGRPYFAMEYVKGVPITEHCDRQKLTIEERLRLFVKVCEAIQHAHQKGIIHRDIKPSNIQVCIEGEQAIPKVIDFGVAKALSQPLTERTLVTEQGQLIGTPEYISPEQAEMTNQDIDTRSDVYSLGVLLYELLTGTLPFESQTLRKGNLDQMRQIIRETEPKTPSTRVTGLDAEASTRLAKCCQNDTASLRRRLRGDLDWITLKAMEKDRMRRYQTAHALAEDIERHLNNEPVSAGRPGTLYRFQKLVRRNRGVFATTAVVATVLVLGVFVSTWQAVRATRAEREQKLQRQRASEAAQALRHSLYLADLNAAQLALQENNLGRAVDLVNKYFPKPGEPDLRGIEWRYLWNCCQGDESFVLDFHGYPVSAASRSPDGKLVALASFDNKVTIVDTGSKKVLARLNGSFNLINGQTVAFSPDGKVLASADQGAINLWHTDVWSLAGRLEGESFTGGSITVLFSPDGQTVSTACAGKLAFWDRATCHLVMPVNATARPFPHGHRLVYSPDGQTLAYATIDGIQLWDVRSRSWIEQFARQMSGITSLAWSSHWLAAGSWFGDLKLWDMRTRREIINFKAHPTFTFALAFSPDGKTLASGGGDQKIHFWDVAALDYELADSNTPKVSLNLQRTATLQGHRHEVWTLAYSPDGQALVTGSKDGTARFWGPLHPRETTSLEGARVPLRFSADGRSLLVLSTDQTLAEWDVLSRQKTRMIDLRLNAKEVQSVAVAPDGRTFAVGMTTGSVELLNLDKQQRFAQKQFGGEPVVRLDFSPKGNLLAVLVRNPPRQSPSEQLLVWNPTTGEVFGPFGNEGSAFACSPDETQLATVAPGYQPEIYDLRTAKPVVTLRRHTWFVSDMCFSPDGRLFATGSSDNTAVLWDAASWSQRAILRGHMGGVGGPAFSADGKVLVSGSADGAVKLWDIDTCQELLSLSTAFPQIPGKVMLSPDESALAVQTRQRFGGLPGDVILLRAPTFAEIDEREKANAAARAVVGGD
jgi:WD40 repeat protein/serine/threonine protein kinase